MSLKRVIQRRTSWTLPDVRDKGPQLTKIKGVLQFYQDNTGGNKSRPTSADSERQTNFSNTQWVSRPNRKSRVDDPNFMRNEKRSGRFRREYTQENEALLEYIVKARISSGRGETVHTNVRKQLAHVFRDQTKKKV